jgi:hypothetical protein
MNRNITGWFSIVMGIAILVSWTLILLQGSLPEGKIELGFHLYAEFAVAVICLVSGIMLLKDKPYATETNMGGLGMLVYSVLNAAGYYGQQGDKGMTAVFIGLFVLSVTAICLHYTRKRSVTIQPE